MDENKLNPNQKEKFDKVMNTQVGNNQQPINPPAANMPQPTPNQQTQPAPAAGTAQPVTPAQTPFGASPSGQSAPFVANASVPSGPGQASSPVGGNGKSSMPKVILIAVIGVILLVVYAIIWAFVFGISIPFLPF